MFKPLLLDFCKVELVLYSKQASSTFIKSCKICCQVAFAARLFQSRKRFVSKLLQFDFCKSQRNCVLACKILHKVVSDPETFPRNFNKVCQHHFLDFFIDFCKVSQPLFLCSTLLKLLTFGIGNVLSDFSKVVLILILWLSSLPRDLIAERAFPVFNENQSITLKLTA